MGYYTRYKLSIVDYSGDGELIEEFRHECESAAYAFDRRGNALDSLTWYDHEEDLCDFSSKHPGVLFKLEGEGEEAPDLWRKYFKDGKCQECKAEIVFEPFDESKLI